MNFDPKNRQHVLVVVALVVVGLVVGNNVILTPLLNSWKNRTKQISDLKTKVHSGERLIARGNEVEALWTEYRTNALAAEPSTAEQQMSGAFERWITASGITMPSYRPQWKRGEDDSYMSLECRAELIGSIEGITKFLWEMGHDPIGVKVDSADLSTRDPDGARINLTLTVTGLQLASSTR